MNATMGGSLFLFPSSSSSSSLTVSKTTLSSSSPSMSLISTTARHRRRAPNRSFPRSLIIETVQGQTSDGKDKEEEEEEEEEEESRSESVSRRRLILLRHANSSWEDRSLRDHDRPLSRTGQSDAIEVSQKLQKLGWIPELILSSDAVRTRETLKIMQEQVKGFLEAEVHYISSFYSIAAMDGQTAEHLQHAICKFSRDEILTVMCMGHNRGWEEAASMFSGASIELKTCNAALLEATGQSWEEAFSLAGFGGWKLQGIVKPTSSL
ncbi:uncharacterized protein At3g52155, chloroplastic [Rhododendron vialii]|uniref:uncharacterized protein At3g52155, chloroplastic n=1 Tax=Rhododendron vialii TaxID=182163 RepID=UPI00265FCD2B|nr:uncharacterized protein At3g52155, chloroplastic [Rhododendron vialii]XP_058197598.1 uncharacterized protein At3g52155, chloroplastic [Rhododendron vialii]